MTIYHFILTQTALNTYLYCDDIGAATISSDGMMIGSRLTHQLATWPKQQVFTQS